MLCGDSRKEEWEADLSVSGRWGVSLPWVLREGTGEQWAEAQHMGPLWGWGSHGRRCSKTPIPQCFALPLARGEVLPVVMVVVAIRGERRVPLRGSGEVLAEAFLVAPRSRLFPSLLGVFRMLKANDWRLLV